jgi:hypothetical protein
MNTLEDMLLAEQARCRHLLREYVELGSAAAFARALLEDGLRSAEEAVQNKQLVLMQRALDRLARFQTVNPLAIKLSHGATPINTRRMAPAARPMPRMQEQFFTWTRAA